MRSRQNGGLWIEAGRNCENAIDTATRRKTQKKKEKTEKTRNPKKKEDEINFPEEKSENLGCGNLSSGLPQGNYLKWLIVFFVFH